MLAALRDAGVALSPTFGATHVRAVTHLDLDDADIDRALELVAETLVRMPSPERSPPSSTARRPAD